MVDSPSPLLAFPRKPERQHLFLSLLVLLGISYMLFMRAQFPGARSPLLQGRGLLAAQPGYDLSVDPAPRHLPPADMASPNVEPVQKRGPNLAPGTVTVTVHATVLGKTTTYIGATEAGGFWINDLTDLGLNTYRLWTKMNELEWWDDDDAVDENWDDSEYGTPTIVQIRADAGNGFTNTIPWASWWDDRFDEVQSWRYGVQTRRGIIEALVQKDITPLVVLRTIDDQGNPDYWPGVRWAPKPPVDQDFLNEWWEHCFAIAYWLNVRNDYGVTRFEVLNEPDWPGQGWQEYGGTEAEYVQMVQIAYDAVKYANDIAGIETYIHAPVVASYGSAYVADSLDGADDEIRVVDYHTYDNDPTASITGIKSTIAMHNPDGVTEPIWVSEWGALWSSYDTFNRAMLTANQLLTFSEEQVEGVTIFNMYDWSTTAGQDWGLVDLQDDGFGGALHVLTESYYAFRLMTRGLVGGKERLETTASGLSANTRVMATRDDANVYLIVLQNNVGTPVTPTIDLSELGVGFGTATVYEYSASHKDEVVVSPLVAAGVFTFTAPADGISLAVIPHPDLSASTKAVDPVTVYPGEPLTYTLVLTNTGAVGPARACFTDTRPAHTTYAAGPWASSGQAGYAGDVITWSGAVSAGMPVTVTYRVTVAQPVDDGTAITNTALVDDGVRQQVEIGPATATVSSAPDLGGSLKAVEPPTVRPGAGLTYTLLLSNRGTVNASAVRLTDTLPLSTTYAAGPWASSGQAGYGGGVITWSGTVSAGMPVTITYRVTVAQPVDDGTAITNTALVHDVMGGRFVTLTAVAAGHWHRFYLPLMLRSGPSASN